MDRVHAGDEYLRRLRAWREGAAPDLTLRNLPEHVSRRIERPHRQLGQIKHIWDRLAPEHLAEHTVLAGFSAGVLTIHVGDSSTLYELDRLLRSGLERQIRQACRASLRRIKVRVAAID